MIEATSGQRGIGGESPAGRSLSQIDRGLSVCEGAFVSAMMGIRLAQSGVSGKRRPVAVSQLAGMV